MRDVVILAAGQGTRMNSDLPKVMHPLGGRPMLAHVLDTARSLRPDRLHVVHGHGAEAVRSAFPEPDIRWVLQPERLGTAHAVAQALPGIPSQSRVLVLYGDVPLVRKSTLEPLLEALDSAELALLTVHVEDPTGYGRILRDAKGEMVDIVEHGDADEQARAIREINTGILTALASNLATWIDQIGNANAQSEYYLTDTVGLCVLGGGRARAIGCTDSGEVAGVNDKLQLAEAERHYQRQAVDRLMRRGVTVSDPARLDLRGEVVAGRDVSLDVNVILEGRVVLGNDVHIGPGCLLRNAIVGAGTRVQAYSVIEDAEIGSGCRVGPYSRIRPQALLGDGVHIGNFVEIKKSRIDTGSKVNHLSYVGDSSVGAGVNIGAGTITCNYDGAQKHRTVIGDDAFIGSNTQLVAPVTVGRGATIGAGSTITRDAPADKLTVSRARQTTLEGWRRPRKPGS